MYIHKKFITGLWELCHHMVTSRVSFETSFDSKQPKLEPKLVSALSETKRLFRLFRFYTETESFDVSIEPKQTKDQPKQFLLSQFKCRQFLSMSLGSLHHQGAVARLISFWSIIICISITLPTGRWDTPCIVRCRQCAVQNCRLC